MSAEDESSACCPHCLEMFAINVLKPPDGYTAAGECPHCGKRVRVEVKWADKR